MRNALVFLAFLEVALSGLHFIMQCSDINSEGEVPQEESLPTVQYPLKTVSSKESIFCADREEWAHVK